MSQTNGHNSDTEQRLQSALVEYLEAVESGNVPDRERFLARYPDIAVELSEFLADREQLDAIAAPLREAVQECDKPSSDCRPILSGDISTRQAVGNKVRYFGDYELLEEIARGGMGVVYKARQTTLKREVALKMILSGQLAGEDDVKRFYAEAEAAAKLQHPNIVPIFEIGQHERQHYFSMALVDGESLAHKVAAGPLAPRQAAELMKQVADAVAYAHVEGVIHRDLKLANILVDKDGVRHITDFGLAKRIPTESLTPEDGNEAARLTVTGQILGTPSYMPPEQASGKTAEIGPLSDVYALGAVLYCLLTGRPPFQAASPLDTLLQVLEREPVRVRRLVPKVPRDLETICLKCLEKDPRRRYDSARSLAEELQRFLNGEPIVARPVGPARRAWRWGRRSPWPAGVLVTVATLVVLVSAMAAVRYVARARLEATARSFVDLLVQGDFTKATLLFDEPMTKSVPAENVETSWKLATGGMGEFQRQGSDVGIERVLQYDFVYVPCQFERSEVVVKVVFDREKRITGYFFLEHNSALRSTDDELTQLKTLATAFIDQCARGEYDQAVKVFDSIMTRVATPQFLRESWTDLRTRFGTFRNQRVVGYDEIGGYVRIYVECEFEKASLVYKVVFNSEKQITGLETRPESVVFKEQPDETQQLNPAIPQT